jgi:dihydroxyacetone kinase-like protein
MTLDSTWARRFVERAADTVSENRSALVELDREIGDGDHGENLERGFSAVRAKLAAQPDDATPGALLKMVATTLISTVGGASGPLLGTAFLKGAGALGDATEIDSAGVAAFVAAARDGAVLRGKAEVGDKTMVDAWTPATAAGSLPPCCARRPTPQRPVPSRPSRSSPARDERATSANARSATGTPARSRPR